MYICYFLSQLHQFVERRDLDFVMLPRACDIIFVNVYLDNKGEAKEAKRTEANEAAEGGDE